MSSAYKLLTTSIIIAVLLSGCSSTEKFSRVSGDSIGANCSKMSFTIDEFQMRYSVGDKICTFFYKDGPPKGLEWYKFGGVIAMLGDGIPDVLKITSSVYIYNIKSNSVKKISEINPPKEWKMDLQNYSIKTKTMRSGQVFLVMRGVVDDEDKRTESKYFKIDNSGKIKEVGSMPNITSKQKSDQKQCASTLSYNINDATLSYIKASNSSFNKVVFIKDGDSPKIIE